MKKVPESVKPVKNENDLFSGFSEKEILSLQSMSWIRGGDGLDPIIIIPPPPPQPWKDPCQFSCWKRPSHKIIETAFLFELFNDF